MHVAAVRRRPLVVASWVLVLSLGTVACSDEPEPSQSAAEAEVCAGVDVVQAALRQVQALNRGSTIEEVEAARDGLRTSIDGFRASVAGLAEADQNAMENGFEDISAAIDDLGGSDTIGEAAADVQASTQGLRDSLQEMSDGYECG
jgi:hypothetical protein